MSYAKSLKDLMERLTRLPGIGPRTAERLAFHILHWSDEEAKGLADAIVEVKKKISYCPDCHNLIQDGQCRICTDGYRDRKTICVVGEPNGLAAIENAGHYKGLYHVLLGTLSPLEGVGPDDLTIKPLVRRIKEKDIEEVILATDADAEGEATAHYLGKILKPLGVKVTRLASGIPVGASVDYTDKATLARALDGRREF